MPQPKFNQLDSDDIALREAFSTAYPRIPWDQRFSSKTWAHKTRSFEATWTAATAAERARCCSIVFGQCASDNVAQRTVDAIRGTRAPNRLRAPVASSAGFPAEPAPVLPTELSGSPEAMAAQLLALLPDPDASAPDFYREARSATLSTIIRGMLAQGWAVTYQSLGDLLANPLELSKLVETVPARVVRDVASAMLWGYEPPDTNEAHVANFNTIIAAVTGRVAARARALRAVATTRRVEEA